MTKQAPGCCAKTAQLFVIFVDLRFRGAWQKKSPAAKFWGFLMVRKPVHKNDATYKDYETEIKKFNTYDDELQITNNELITFQSNIRTFKASRDYHRRKFDEAKLDLQNALQAFKDDITKTIRSRIMAEQLKTFFAVH